MSDIDAYKADVGETMSAYEEYMAEEDQFVEQRFSEDDKLALEYESLVKTMSPDQLKDNIKMGFTDIKHHTAKAILFETYVPLTGEICEQWLPKGVCSNLCWEGKFVYVWNKFAEDNLPEWYEDPLS
jgi:hypothetical protein